MKITFYFVVLSFVFILFSCNNTTKTENSIEADTIVEIVEEVAEVIESRIKLENHNLNIDLNTCAPLQIATPIGDVNMPFTNGYEIGEEDFGGNYSCNEEKCYFLYEETKKQWIFVFYAEEIVGIDFTNDTEFILHSSKNLDEEFGIALTINYFTIIDCKKINGTDENIYSYQIIVE